MREKKATEKIGRLRRKDTQFKPGNPGKPRGAISRFTTMKQSFLEVFQDLGGTAALLEWVRASAKNRRDFYGWIARMLPADINITEERKFPRVIIVTKLEDGPKVACGQEELDALGDDASPEMQALQTRNLGHAAGAQALRG